MPIPYPTLLALWQRALEAEIGLVVETDNQRSLLNELYEARKVSGDERLAGMSMHIVNLTEIFICHRPAKLP